MIHVKLLVVDNSWVVVGSTNFDNRSFGINDEVNLATLSGELAAQLTSLFEEDVANSKAITYAEWQKRGPVERVTAWLGWFLERQQ
jgi:cardiolipin synthase